MHAETERPAFGRLALHTWTLDTTPLPVALHAARQAGFDAVELRWLDFRRCLDGGMRNDDVLRLVRDGGVPVCALGVEYGWLFATGEESRRLWDEFRQTCANARALDCDTLMSAPGLLTGTVRDAVANLRIAGELAAEHGLRLALEFSSQHELVNTLGVLAEILAGAGRPNCGMVLDAYHLARSGAGGRGFAAVPPEHIFLFQFSDVPASPVVGDKRPADRLLPGQGTVRWAEVFGLLAEKDYRGVLSYEAPNPATWARPPQEVAAEAVAAARRLMRAAGVLA